LPKWLHHSEAHLLAGARAADGRCLALLLVSCGCLAPLALATLTPSGRLLAAGRRRRALLRRAALRLGLLLLLEIGLLLALVLLVRLLLALARPLGGGLLGCTLLLLAARGRRSATLRGRLPLCALRGGVLALAAANALGCDGSLSSGDQLSQDSLVICNRRLDKHASGEM